MVVLQDEETTHFTMREPRRTYLLEHLAAALDSPRTREWPGARRTCRARHDSLRRQG
jgi:hypothetical protein